MKVKSSHHQRMPQAGVDIEISRLLCFTDRRLFGPNAVSEYTVCFLVKLLRTS